jgi:hypothetical protein
MYLSFIVSIVELSRNGCIRGYLNAVNFQCARSSKSYLNAEFYFANKVYFKTSSYIPQTNFEDHSSRVEMGKEEPAWRHRPIRQRRREGDIN